MTDTHAAPIDASADALDAHLEATHDERIESYKDFLRIPSISGIPTRRVPTRASSGR